MEKRSLGRVRNAIQWGTLICVAEVLLCLIIAPKQGGMKEAYLRLNQWDSVHYMDIVDHGYHVPSGILSASDVHSNRTNLAFFPAYPFLAIGVKKLFHLSTPFALLFTAQFFCWLFWIHIFLLLELWEINSDLIKKTAVAIGVFPSSFFLITGYSESIFMASLVGLIYWTEVWIKDEIQKSEKNFSRDRRPTSGIWREGGWSWYGAGVSGFLLTSSRLVGIPLMVYPVLRWWGERLRDRKSGNKGNKRRGENRRSRSRSGATQAFLLSGVVGLGGVTFFGLCQLWYGHWDIYIRLQQLGWGNQPNYLALFNPLSYLPKLFFEDTTTSVCKLSNLFILVLFIILFLKEAVNNHTINNNSDGMSARLGLYFSAASVFLISLSGKANYNMDSMVRYNLPVFVVLVLIAVQVAGQGERLHRKGIFSDWSRVIWILGCALALAVQCWMIRVFTKGGWVA